MKNRYCPFCSAGMASVEDDEDYSGYYHYKFRCGTSYSWYVTKWTNRPSFGSKCELKNELDQKDHFCGLSELPELLLRRKIQTEEEYMYRKDREEGRIIKIQVKFPGNWREYVYEAPNTVKVGDHVIVKSPYSGMTKVEVVAIGSGSYTGPVKMIQEVLPRAV